VENNENRNSTPTNTTTGATLSIYVNLLEDNEKSIADQRKLHGPDGAKTT
jgi:hypothetical protein